MKSYKIQKVFRAVDIPEEIIEDMLIDGCLQRRRLIPYTVGNFVSEVDAALKNGDNGYCMESYKRSKTIDQWLIDNGAELYEEIIISHV